jgi:hypothetical protein
MNVAQLREVLETVEAHYRKDRRVEIADALSAFAKNLLRDNDNLTVQRLVNRIEAARKPSKSKLRGSASRKR